MKSKNTKIYFSLLRNNIFMIRKIWKYSPFYIVIIMIKVIIDGIIDSLWVIFTVRILNSFDSGRNFTYISNIIIVASLIYLIWFFIRSLITNVIEPLLIKKMQYGMHQELFDKARTADISCYDDPDFYNNYVWSMGEIDNRAILIINSFARIGSLFISSSIVFNVIATLNFFVAIILVINSIATLFIQLYSKKIWLKEKEKVDPLVRKRDYVKRIFYLQEYAKEIRLSRISECLLDLYDSANKDIINIKSTYGRRKFICWGIVGNLLDQIAYFGTLFIMFFELIGGHILVGTFAGTMGTIWNLKYSLADFIYYFTEFQEHSYSIEKYISFLNHEPKIKSGECRVTPFESLSVRNVSFTYENKTEKTLDDVNMELKKGERIAIVGFNGAGKTTLVKLLMRLYDPTSGEILYNGKSLPEYNIVEYRKLFGTVFQDFKLFAVTLAENVVGDSYTERKKSLVISALNKASFSDRLQTLEKGIYTQLFHEFEKDGINLSGGESQKVAIARMLARESDVLILDEPSSSLDPSAENELNQTILKIAVNKTVILISHRLSTTRMADRIYVFEKGKIIEHGNHNELMMKNGKYAQMFNVQSQKYIPKTSVLPGK